MVRPLCSKEGAKSGKYGINREQFEIVAREWFMKHAPNWASTHSSKVIRRLELDAFPWIGARAFGEITAPELLTVLRRVESRGALDTAYRVHQNCGQVFRYAIATGRAQRDPSADLRGALPPVNRQHYPTITDPKAIGELLRAIDGYSGTYSTRYALRLAPMLFVRPSELRKAEWCEFNLDKGEWRVPDADENEGAAYSPALYSSCRNIARALLRFGWRKIYFSQPAHDNKANERQHCKCRTASSGL